MSGLQTLERSASALLDGTDKTREFEYPAPVVGIDDEWLSGVVAESMPKGSPMASLDQEHDAPGPVAFDSVFWCESRFVCASMHCGGSGWC